MTGTKKKWRHLDLCLVTSLKCNLLHTDCEDGEIACSLGRIGGFGRSCIPESRVCNGFRDCIGGTDEVNCTGSGKTFIVNRRNGNALICVSLI